MKIQFSREVAYRPQWNGNATSDAPFTVKLRPCEFGELLVIVDLFQQAGLKDGDDATKVDAGQIRAITQAAAHLLKDYAVVEGLESEEGPITIEDVLKYGTFMTLQMELLGKLAEISAPSGEDEKN